MPVKTRQSKGVDAIPLARRVRSFEAFTKPKNKAEFAERRRRFEIEREAHQPLIDLHSALNAKNKVAVKRLEAERVRERREMVRAWEAMSRKGVGGGAVAPLDKGDIPFRRPIDPSQVPFTPPPEGRVFLPPYPLTSYPLPSALFGGGWTYYPTLPDPSGARLGGSFRADGSGSIQAKQHVGFDYFDLEAGTALAVLEFNPQGWIDSSSMGGFSNVELSVQLYVQVGGGTPLPGDRLVYASRVGIGSFSYFDGTANRLSVDVAFDRAVGIYSVWAEFTFYAGVFGGAVTISQVVNVETFRLFLYK